MLIEFQKMFHKSYIFGLMQHQLLMNHEALEQTVISRCKNYIQFLSGEVVAQSVRDRSEELRVLASNLDCTPNSWWLQDKLTVRTLPRYLTHQMQMLLYFNALSMLLHLFKCSCVCQKRNCVLNPNFISISK